MTSSGLMKGCRSNSLLLSGASNFAKKVIQSAVSAMSAIESPRMSSGFGETRKSEGISKSNDAALSHKGTRRAEKRLPHSCCTASIVVSSDG